MSLRVQTGYAQTFLYPKRAYIVDEPTLANQSGFTALWFDNRPDAVIAGVGLYYAATRKLGDCVWAINHEPIVEIVREGTDAPTS